ncbi:hypothetical protein [Prauserella cavernicola]|uniref:Uncharacterized protein n=1 Tax=Prauserella cavernicola TaxID=2800127 RepID=A0A934QSM8_9PSEU|nr:hypothetical protein [Prauserella cavernicola]MBK1785595.1 hypothetical protein [Prauserella cavernicola]
MSAEEAHELGRDGVFRVKQYLEGTTHLRLPWTAYDHVNLCKRQRLDGSKKTYDLAGHFLGERRRPLFVEAKKYTTAGAQGTLYLEYIADVYSITARAQREEMDDGAEFMWITWHPFSQGAWPRLLSHEYVYEAVEKHVDSLQLGGGDGNAESAEPDKELCRTVADRLWLVVLTDRQQEELTLTAEELKLAMMHLKREGA